MAEKSVFEQKNIQKALLHFAVPAVITILMAELYNMIDTFFVGRHAGASAIAALSIAFPVQRLIIALSLMVGVGAGTAISRALGARDEAALSKSVQLAIGLGMVFLALLPLLFYLFPGEILHALGARGEIFRLSKEYTQIVVSGSLFLGFTNIFGYALSASGRPRITLAATALGALLNAIMDHILVGRLSMGVQGAAIATVLSQFFSFLFILYHMLRFRRQHGFRLRPKIGGRAAFDILAVGFATFIVEISDAVLIFSLNNVLLPIGGAAALVIVGSITRVSMFMYITIIGISAGMQSLAAYHYSAQNYAKLRKIVKSSCRLVLLSSLLLWGLIMLFARPIIGSFLKDPALLQKTVDVFRLTIVIFPAISLYYVFIYYCQALNMPGLGFFMSILRQLLLFIPLMLAFSGLFGVFGVWLAYPVSDGISALIGSLLLVRQLKKLPK